LLHPLLDPLDPADAATDVDGSGRTALQAYLESIAPPVLTSIIGTSPAHDAIGVSVTAVIGQVFASELGVDEHGQPLNVPLQGVIVTVDGAGEPLDNLTGGTGMI